MLRRLRASAASGRVRFTVKALRELSGTGIGLDERDGCRVLARLTTDDVVGRTVSERTGEWLYVFQPEVAGTVVYVKVVLRAACVVVSFHREVANDEDEEGHEG